MAELLEMVAAAAQVDRRVRELKEVTEVQVACLLARRAVVVPTAEPLARITRRVQLARQAARVLHLEETEVPVVTEVRMAAPE